MPCRVATSIDSSPLLLSFSTWDEIGFTSLGIVHLRHGHNLLRPATSFSSISNSREDDPSLVAVTSICINLDQSFVGVPPPQRCLFGHRGTMVTGLSTNPFPLYRCCLIVPCAARIQTLLGGKTNLFGINMIFGQHLALKGSCMVLRLASATLKRLARLLARCFKAEINS